MQRRIARIDNYITLSDNENGVSMFSLPYFDIKIYDFVKIPVITKNGFIKKIIDYGETV